MYSGLKRFAEKKGITPVISVIILVLMVVAISAATYTWFMVAEHKIMASSETQVATVQKSMAQKLMIVGLNSTRTGVIVQNLGDEEITSANVIVNGQIVNVTGILIPAGSYATVPIGNESVAPQDDNTIEVSLVGLDFGSATKIFLIAETYDIEILNVTCSPCTLGTGNYCTVTIDGINYCSHDVSGTCVYVGHTNDTNDCT